MFLASNNNESNNKIIIHLRFNVPSLQWRRGAKGMLCCMNSARCPLGCNVGLCLCSDCVCRTSAVGSHPSAEALVSLPHQPLTGRYQPLVCFSELVACNQDLLSSLWKGFFAISLLSSLWMAFLSAFLLFSQFSPISCPFCLLLWLLVSWLCRLLINSCHSLSPLPSHFL